MSSSTGCSESLRVSGGRVGRWISMILCALGACPQVAAAAEIDVRPNHLVSLPAPKLERNEVWVAASRTESNDAVAVFHAGAKLNAPTEGWDGCEVMVSHDGGQLWQRAALPDMPDCFDPMVVAGPRNEFYFSFSSWRMPNPVWGEWRMKGAPITVFTSSDGGRTWSSPHDLYTPLNPDHERITVDVGGGPSEGRLYVSWNEFPTESIPGEHHLFLSHFDQHDATPSKPVLIDKFDDTQPVALEPVVLSNGHIIVPYLTMSLLPSDPRNDSTPVKLYRSTDGGLHFRALEGEVVRKGAGVWRTRTHRFTIPSNVNVFVADTGRNSPYRDHIYTVWADVRAGTSDVWLAYSADEGQSWSQPVKVNDYAGPYSETGIPDYREVPVVAIRQDGVVGVAWYDHRDDHTGRCWKYYFSASLDGGKTFLPNRPVSSAASCSVDAKAPAVDVYGTEPKNLPSWDELRARNEFSYFGTFMADSVRDLAEARVREESDPNARKPRIYVSFDTARGEWLGDYSGLAATADGEFQAGWVDGRGDSREIYSARVRVLTAKKAPEPQLKAAPLTARVEVLADRVSFDAANGITTVNLRLRNFSDTPVYGPMKLRVSRVVSGGGEIENADNRQRSVGAEWDFSDRIGTSRRLDPHEISEPRTIKIRSSVDKGMDMIFDYEIDGRIQ